MRAEARRQAALAYYTQRSPPPKFRPGIIIATVIIAGILVIGIIMTIVAYLPGYSAEGVDKLRIVSPIIFALGAALLIGLIVLVCMRSSAERRMFEKSLHEISTASRHTLASRRSVARSETPSIDAKPQRSILKQGSTSTYNGGRDSQNYSQSSSAASSYQGTGSTGSQGRGVHYNVNMKPDPYNNAYNQGRGGPKPVVRNPNRSYGEPEIDDRREVPLHSAPPGRQTSSNSDNNSRRSYDNGAYDSYDPNSVAGQGMLTPGHNHSGTDIRAASPASTTTSTATPRRWGQSGHNTSQGSMTGFSDHSREKVSVVTEVYRDIQPGTTPRTQTTTVTTTRRYEKDIPSSKPTQQYQQVEPQGSTEV